MIIYYDKKLYNIIIIFYYVMFSALFNNIFKYKRDLYLKILRTRIYYIKNIRDIIRIMKNIEYFHKNLSSDELCNILISCFNYYPLTQHELQKFSLIQQDYNYELGMKNYASFIMWLVCIQYINERPNMLLK
jgi:hypothetical protein